MSGEPDPKTDIASPADAESAREDRSRLDR